MTCLHIDKLEITDYTIQNTDTDKYSCVISKNGLDHHLSTSQQNKFGLVYLWKLKERALTFFLMSQTRVCNWIEGYSHANYHDDSKLSGEKYGNDAVIITKQVAFGLPFANKGFDHQHQCKHYPVGLCSPIVQNLCCPYAAAFSTTKLALFAKNTNISLTPKLTFRQNLLLNFSGNGHLLIIVRRNGGRHPAVVLSLSF